MRSCRACAAWLRGKCVSPPGWVVATRRYFACAAVSNLGRALRRGAKLTQTGFRDFGVVATACFMAGLGIVAHFQADASVAQKVGACEGFTGSGARTHHLMSMWKLQRVLAIALMIVSR